MAGDPTDASPKGKNASGGDSAKKVLDALQRARTTRDLWTETWNDIFEYCFPGRRGFYDSIYDQDQGQVRNGPIYDETAQVEVERLSGRIVAGVFPPNGRAFSLKLHPREKARLRAFSTKEEEKLEALTEDMHDILRNSNFHTELYEAANDLLIGTMHMHIDPGQFKGEIKATALPMTQMYIESGPFGYPAKWIRERKLCYDYLEQVWPKATFSSSTRDKIKASPQEQAIVIDLIERQYDTDGEEKYKHLVCVKDTEDLIVTEKYDGAGSCPHITTRWSTDAGETYGRGPLVRVLPAIKSANLVMEVGFEASQWAMGGLFAYDDDGVLNFENVTVSPGTFLPKARGSEIVPLASNFNADFSLFNLEEMRNNIRRALYSPSPDRPQGRTPPTAMEIADDRAETARNLGTLVSRLQYEFMKPLVRRLIYIMKQQGIADLPTVDGRNVMLVPESPLVRSQDQEDIANFLRYSESLSYVFGQMAVAAHKPEKEIPWLGEKYKIPAELRPAMQEIQQRMQQMAQAAQQQGVLPQGGA